MTKKIFCSFVIVLFFFQTLTIDSQAFADPSLTLPAANQMMSLSAPLQPVMLQGLRYDPQKPFQFQFILEQGDKPLALDQLRDKGMELVRYFMAAMTMPRRDLWVNLSPYEKDRIIPNSLGVTRLGSDMLVEDYILKQLSSSLTFPDSRTGRAFWQKIYNEAQLRLGTTNVPVSTFNKVWIVPDYADVLIKDNTVIVLDSHLKLMMEQDYLAQRKASCGDACLQVSAQPAGGNVASAVMRQVIIPVLEKEVNTGSNFAALRQMYHAVVLAEWYKRNLKDSIFAQYYANQHKVKGIDEINIQTKEAIYKRYLSAYKRGVYNFIREDSVPQTGEIVARKYFAGGLNLNISRTMIHERFTTAEFTPQDMAAWEQQKLSYLMDVGAAPVGSNAMTTNKPQTPKDLLVGMKTKFFSDMQQVFATDSTQPDEVQLMQTLRDQSEAKPWVHVENIETPWGEIVPVLMIRYRYFGKITKGGYRVVSPRDRESEDEQMLEEMLMELSPSLQDQNEFKTTARVQEAGGLSIGMVKKTALRKDLPFRGAKGLIFIGKRVERNGRLVFEKYPKEQFDVINNLASYFYGYRLGEAGLVGPEIDSPAPDQNTGPLQMKLAMEGYLKACLKKGEAAFEWKDSYMEQLEGVDWIKGFKPPLPGTYEYLYRDLISVQDRFEDIALNLNAQQRYEALLKTPLQSYYTSYCRFKRIPDLLNATFTGKEIKDGGIQGREEATGRGLARLVKLYVKLSKKKLKTIGIQGWGNVGSWAGLLLYPDFKITTIGLLGGTIYKKPGLSLEFMQGLQKLIKDNREATLSDLMKLDPDLFAEENVEIRSSDYFFAAPVQVMVLAATQNVLVSSNVKKKLKNPDLELLVEGANDPADPVATRYVSKKGVFVAKDMFANSEGVKWSWLEIIKNLIGPEYMPSNEDVQKRADDEFDQEFEALYKMWEVRNIGVVDPKKQLSFPDLLEEIVREQLVKDQMRLWIDETGGDIKAIQAKFKVRVDANTVVWRIRELGLFDYLDKVHMKKIIAKTNALLTPMLEILEKETGVKCTSEDLLKRIVGLGLSNYYNMVQDKSLFRLRSQILTLLQSIFINQEHVIIDNKQLEATVDRIFPINDQILTDGSKRLATVSAYEELDTLFQGKRISTESFNALRLRIAASQDPTNPDATTTQILIALERLGDITGSNNNAMVGVSAERNGGIDFDASHMLINQQGEANFSQVSSQNPAEWQQINGLKPIFLRLVPVNLSELVGAI